MSRKRKAPKKIQILDPKFKSSIIPKLINSIMLDGKKTVAEKIVYEAIDKIKSKSKEEPILRLVNKHILNPKIKTKNSNRPSTGILDSSLLIQLKYTSGGTVEKSREQLKKGSIAYLSKGWFEVFKTFGRNPEVRHSQFERFFDNRIKQLLKDEIIKSPEPGVFQLVKRLTTDDWRLIESILTLPPHKDLRLTKLKF